MDVMINELKPKGINTVGRDYRLTHLSEKDGYLFVAKLEASSSYNVFKMAQKVVAVFGER